jgi:hypothetical protein
MSFSDAQAMILTVILTGYSQNTSVSAKGASLEWIDAHGEHHTRYFEHWLDDSKQDVAATMCNMRTELCVGDTTDLVEGLSCNRIVWKGTDGATVPYRCGKSIYG